MKSALLAVLALSILIAGCVQPSGTQTGNETANPSLTANEQELQKYPELAGFLRSYQQAGTPAKRPDYLPSFVFSKLPPFPTDFYSVDLLVQNGIFADMKRINIEYWKQPEFYPNFETQAVPVYQHPPTDRWGAFGIGSYPSEVIVQTPRSSTFELNFFMYTSWLVQTYQGVAFNHGFPANGQIYMSQFSDNSRNVVQDPAKVAEYFDVEVTPNDILLEPTFPIFEKDWVQKVTVKVKSKNAPPGKYYIGVGTESPHPDKADEWLWKYKTRYNDGATQYGGIGRPWFNIFIEIE